MAALMRRSRSFLNFKCMRTYAKERLVRDGGFYVLLPEVPPDTAETNPLMRSDTFPQFSQINPDKIVTGCAKVAIEYEVDMDKHITHVQESDVEKTFENVIEPVDKLNSQITFPFLTAKNLSYIKGGDFQKAFQRIGHRMYSARTAKWLSPAFYDLVKDVSARPDELTEPQRRLVNLFLFEAKMAGLEASEEEETRLLRSIRRLAEHKAEFKLRVASCEQGFSQTIADFNTMSEMPKSVARQMVKEGDSPTHGPWTVTLEPHIYHPFLEYCKDRTMRWTVYDAYVNRASRRFMAQHGDNHMRIGDIREHRTLIAGAHGYETFSDMVIVDKMAANVDNVLNLLEYCKTHFKPLGTRDVAAVSDYAQKRGSPVQMEMWDMPYWRRKHREHLYPLYNKDAMLEYFPFHKFSQRLFDLTSKLFGVTIQDHSESVDLWDKGVFFYTVFDGSTGEHLGSFYLDPFQRPNKFSYSWTENGRERSGLLGVTPLVYINLQLPPPLIADQPVLMSVSSLEHMIEAFGNAMRFILDKCPYSELNTSRNMEYDALNIVPKLFSKLFLSKPLAKQLSEHVDSGEPISDELLDVFIQGRHHLHGYDIVQQLYLAAFDMELNLTDDYWLDVKRKVWEEFLPLPHSDDDESPCSMNSVFTDVTAGVMYSPIWSDMVACDLFKAFSDAGLDDVDKLTTVAHRFREHYLSYGNGVSGNEAFRRFIGRDPALESMAEYYSQLRGEV